MKLPCYLVQDLLPLYKDHVCDEQTSADVAEHLSDCAACSALLAEMDAPPQETAVQEEQAAEAAEAPEHRKKESARPAGKNHAGRCGRTAGPDLRFLWLALLDDALLCGPAGRRSCSRRDP